MQNRMKTHQLSMEQTEQLLKEAQTATLATVGADGEPYATPIHFLYWNGHLYFHGLPKGEKLENISRRPAVCLSVYEMDHLLLDEAENPCDTNTKYRSVIARGSAKVIADLAVKEAVLKGIVKKYTPHLAEKALPGNMLAGTAVIEIELKEMTGKYYE